MPVYVSDLFTATPAPVNATPASTQTFQWLRGTTNISGATSSTYTAVTADIGSTLSATQLETNFLATTTATSAATEVVQAFDPIRLFSASEPGVWYDPTDMSTLYQNAAGTIPVTSFGQPVGLMLDKSRGLVLGPELVTNGDFTDPVTTGWAASGSAVLSVVSGRLRVANGATLTGGATYVFSTVAGRSYKWTYFADAATSGGVVVRARDNTTLAVLQTATITTSGSYSVIFVAQGSTTQIQGVNTNSTIGSYSEFDNISVKELPGLHATQSTEASRPLYGIVPVSGRRNLLTQSEAFNEAVWVKQTNVTVTPNAGADRDGVMVADQLNFASTTNDSIYQSIAFTAGQTCTFSLDVKGTVGQTIQISVQHAGGGNTFTPITFDGSWQRFSATATANTGGNANIVVDAAGATPATACFVSRAQLELSATPTAYQRVSTDLDVTEAGVASVGYLRFDGVNDSMSTPTITPGTDKVQVFAGVRKLTDTIGVIAQTSANSDVNAGSLYLISSASSGNYQFQSGGTTRRVVSASPYVAPITNILTGIGDIAGDLTTLRVNGTQVAQATTDQGTGDFLAYPLHLGFRSGLGDLPFNGHLFPLIVRFGPTLTAARIAATEAWVATKTGGVTL